MPRLIWTLWLSFRVLEPGNRVWSTSKQIWSLHCHLIYVQLLKPEVTIYSHMLTAQSYAKKVDLPYPHPDATICNYLDQSVSDLHEGLLASPWAPVLCSFAGIDSSLWNDVTINIHRASEKLALSHAGRSESRCDIRKSGDGLVCQRFMIPYSNIHCSC